MQVQTERVNDGVLCTFAGGGTVWFESRGDAAVFGQNLVKVALLGADSLDNADLKRWSTEAGSGEETP